MLNDLQKKEFLKLENRIWKTYQSRIKAATRLKEMSNKLDFYSTYYTIALSILSVFSLISHNDIFNYFLVVLSILVMGMTFYGNSMNLNDKHISMKNNYLKLGDLYYKCLTSKINEIYDFAGIYEEYSKLLKENENHTMNDYRRYCYYDKNVRLSKDDKLKLIFSSLKIKLLYFILFIFPLILLSISIFVLLK